jgi:hypothetical protein
MSAKTFPNLVNVAGSRTSDKDVSLGAIF